MFVVVEWTAAGVSLAGTAKWDVTVNDLNDGGLD
jgi:hypothetical protein